MFHVRALNHRLAAARCEVEKECALLIGNANAAAQRVHSRAQKHQAREDTALARLRLRFGAVAEFAHQVEQLIDADARGDILESTEAHHSLAIDHECGRERDTAVLARVEQAVRLDRVARGVAQQREFDAELTPHRFRARSIIDRDRDQLGARRTKILEVLRIVRQLAEAERSPVPAIKDDDAHSALDQIVETANRSGRVGDRKLGRALSYGRSVTFVHGSTIVGRAN